MYFLRQLIDLVTYPFRMLMQLPVGIISAPRRLFGLSLPARVAWLLFLLLIILVIVAFVAGIASKGAAQIGLWFGVRNLVAIVVLLVVIPLVAYLAVKLWLEGESSRFPDIDRAWKDGMAALAEHGIDISSVPAFLVVGVGDPREADTLMNASQLSFTVKSVPSGAAALHWYASPDAVFLVCTDVTRTGRLVRRAGETAGAPAAAPPASAGSTRNDPLRGTIVAGAGGDVRETAAPPVDTPAEPAAPSAGIRGTMMVSPETMMVPPAGGSNPSAAAGIVSLTTAEAAELTARLEYICQLLRRERQPVCPANGILAVLPFELIQRSAAEGIQVQRAVRGDLEALRKGLKLRCPVTALMAGMETEPGFRELVKRVGPDRAKVQRFGKGFNVWNPPIPEQVEAVAANACGAFEDWAYLLFRERDGLTRPGNTKLYSLLCKIRTHLRTRLTNILVSAFADDSSNKSAGSEPLMFSGCYFAATGAHSERQAFVKSVFDKMLDEEEELEWTDEALAENDWYHRWAQFMLLVDALLLVALIGVVMYRWWG